MKETQQPVLTLFQASYEQNPKLLCIKYQELARELIRKLELAKIQTTRKGDMGSAAYEPALKKARIFSVTPLSVDENGFGNSSGVSGQDQVNGDLDCRRFGTPEGCPYGTKCRFKHGPADERQIEQPVSALGSKTKPCTKFFSTSGCPYGEGCHFLHCVPGGIAALGLMPLGVAVGTPTALTPTSGMRTVMGGFGPNSSTPLPGGSPDPSVTVGGYKTRLCNKFSTPEGCRFGDKCHFAHGESDLRPSNVRSNGVDHLGNCSYQNWLSYMQEAAYANGGTHLLPPVATAIYYGEPTPPGVMPATAAGFGLNSGNLKMSIEAVLAGAIIGKAGANVKQISRLTGCKLTIRDHESNASMRNVEMEGTYEQIERASEMVRQFLSHKEVVPQRVAAIASHNFKTKLCENFSQGTCTFADRCHFAHGTSELRPLTRS
ncbi:zinc finger CCCH domain-containing protein 14 isoform X2 [Physcomitrium patens]|uniref:C3H1-type domain-containing protein n=1 Tax=Physcomitrium patens TaxID=3218 RepID=A0A2K1JEE5_PHYPA|nr:zinc finger CCCH domain-containing protein 14-like isoform X3 [Physcomitrium patens]PNR39906.1 hypothetical protein PHYPA_020186 [Physcomitrium patens]|eukprot:XP_024396650.1 zinc finger CCCH domain-containing protein 14-like isoform X3 [Physcomitrella patens]